MLWPCPFVFPVWKTTGLRLPESKGSQAHVRFGSQPELSQGLHCPPQGHEGGRLQAQVSSCQEDSAMFFQHCCDPMLSCLVTKGFRLLRIGGSEEERQRRKSIFQLLPHPHPTPPAATLPTPELGQTTARKEPGISRGSPPWAARAQAQEHPLPASQACSFISSASPL